MFLFKADQKYVATEYLDMADKLNFAIGTSLTEGKRTDWAKSFQTLNNEKGKSKEKINKLLDWYIKNYEYSMVRSVEDAEEFCDYFNKIKKSMQIKQEGHGSGKGAKQAVQAPEGKEYPTDT